MLRQAGRAAEKGAVAALVRSIAPFSLSSLHTGTSTTASIPAVSRPPLTHPPPRRLACLAGKAGVLSAWAHAWCASGEATSEAQAHTRAHTQNPQRLRRQYVVLVVLCWLHQAAITSGE